MKTSGAVYIFKKIGGVWSQVAKLTADDGADGDRFGYSVSISGSAAIVGAISDDDNGTNSGSAYIFEQSNGIWSQVAKLTASDGEASDEFGYSVSISNRQAVVGNLNDDDHGDGSGSAYVFEQSNGTWIETAKLTASDAAIFDRFGVSVAISDDTVIVGADEDDPPLMYWVDLTSKSIQRATLEGSSIQSIVTTGIDSPRGIALDLVNNNVYWTDGGIRRASFDGTQVEDVVTNGISTPFGIAVDSTSGKVYWTAGRKIQRLGVSGVEDLVTPTTADINDPWGIDVDVANGKIYWVDGSVQKVQRANLDGSDVEELITGVMGPMREIALDVSGGAMYFAAETSILSAKLDGTDLTTFFSHEVDTPTGLDIDVLNEKLYWTIPSRNGATAKIQRADLDGTNVETLVTFSNGGLGGIALDLEGRDFRYNSGSAYIFKRIGGVWSQVAKLTPSDLERDNRFGQSVSIAGDTAVVGAKMDDDNGTWSGSAYIFEQSEGTWNQVAKLRANDGTAGDEFGDSVAVSGSTVFVGSRSDDDDGSNSGSAYVFQPFTVKLSSDAQHAATIPDSVTVPFGQSLVSFDVDPVDGPNTVTISASAEGYDTGSDTLAITNVAPSISLSGSATVDEGSPYDLTLSVVTDPGNDTVTNFIVHWGDGVTESFNSASVVSHAYADGPDATLITVDLVDEDGTHTNAGALSISVDNVAPTIAISGPASVDEGSQYNLTLGAVTDPAEDTTTQWIVDWGDGTVPQAFASDGVKTHVFTDGSTAPTITVDLVDEDGVHEDAGSLTIAVKNVAPSIEISGNSTVEEGNLYSLTLGMISDPGEDTVTDRIVNWGDGTPSESFTSSGVKTHVYADDNALLTISVDLVDEDGAHQDAGSLEVTVTNVAPTIDISGDASVLEEATYELVLGAIDDPGDDAVFQWIVDWGDGASPETFNSAGFKTHVYLQSATTRTISVDLVDEDGIHQRAGSLSITILDVNHAPAGETQSLSTLEDTNTAITLTGTDPDGHIISYAVLSGPEHGQLTGDAPNLTYTPASNYHGADRITFRVNDGELDSEVATVDISVVAVNDAPVAEPQSLTTNEDTALDVLLVGNTAV